MNISDTVDNSDDLLSIKDSAKIMRSKVTGRNPQLKIDLSFLSLKKDDSDSKEESSNDDSPTPRSS